MQCFWYFVFWLIWSWRAARTRLMLFAFLLSAISCFSFLTIDSHPAFILEPMLMVISIHRSQGMDEYGLPVIDWAIWQTESVQPGNQRAWPRNEGASGHSLSDRISAAIASYPAVKQGTLPSCTCGRCTRSLSAHVPLPESPTSS